MFCKNCGNELNESSAYCLKCGFKNGNGKQYCQNCGEKVAEGQGLCIKCGFLLESEDAPVKEKEVTSSGKHISSLKKAKLYKIIYEALFLLLILSTIFLPVLSSEKSIDNISIGNLSADDLEEILLNDGKLSQSYSLFDDFTLAFSGVTAENAEEDIVMGSLCFIIFSAVAIVLLTIAAVRIAISLIKSIIEFSSLEQNANSILKEIQSENTNPATEIATTIKENFKKVNRLMPIIFGYIFATLYVLISFVFGSAFTNDNGFKIYLKSQYAVNSINTSGFSAAFILIVVIVAALIAVKIIKSKAEENLKREINLEK